MNDDQNQNVPTDTNATTPTSDDSQVVPSDQTATDEVATETGDETPAGAETPASDETPAGEQPEMDPESGNEEGNNTNPGGMAPTV